MVGIDEHIRTVLAQHTMDTGLYAALIDRVVLHDMAPALQGGVQRARFASRLGQALLPLSEWLNTPVD